MYMNLDIKERIINKIGQAPSVCN